jgi:hypothetical protein
VKSEPIKKKKAPEVPNYFLEELKNHPVQEVEISKSNIDSIFALQEKEDKLIDDKKLKDMRKKNAN